MAEKSDDATPKLHIDADWKAQAQAEKQRLRQQEVTQQSEEEEKLPEATFDTLVDSLAYQALSGLGIFADKASGGIMVDLPGAKFGIDLLGVIEQKTKGNLTADEHAHVQRVLSELRSRFVQIATLIEKSHKEGAGATLKPGEVGEEAAPPPPSSSKIQMP